MIKKFKWFSQGRDNIENLELDIKPNALSLKLNINAGKLYNLFFVQYNNSRSHKGRKITLRYGEDHPIIVEPESDTAEDEFQYQPVEGNPKATVCYVRDLQIKVKSENE